MNYKFVEQIVSKYEMLQKSYTGGLTVPAVNPPDWWDDSNFLFELCEAFKFYKNCGMFPIIKWRKLPSLNNARWNSLGTFALFAYFLLPPYRDHLDSLWNFISTVWASTWFSNEHFNARVYDNLLSAISQLGCQKAIKCFKTHWVTQPSVIDVPRSNIVAEKVVKTLENIYVTCKSDKYLNLKFINTNVHI